MKIVKRVLNEQEDRRFDEDEIDLLHFIFERELKPPFREGEIDRYGDYPYYNRDGECVGWLITNKKFVVKNDPFWINIEDKICQVFEFSHNTFDWHYAIEPHLKSWLENQINAEVKYIGYAYG